MSYHAEDWKAFAVKYQTYIVAVVAFVVGYGIGRF